MFLNSDWLTEVTSPVLNRAPPTSNTGKSTEEQKLRYLLCETTQAVFVSQKRVHVKTPTPMTISFLILYCSFVFFKNVQMHQCCKTPRELPDFFKTHLFYFNHCILYVNVPHLFIFSLYMLYWYCKCWSGLLIEATQGKKHAVYFLHHFFGLAWSAVETGAFV